MILITYFFILLKCYKQGAMGIPNFTTFLKSAKLNTGTLYKYDSILIDAQSLLYVAIDTSLKETEKNILLDVNYIVFTEIVFILNTLFKRRVHDETVTIIISLDGEGVPMKWPTQQKRREKAALGRDLYKIVLFGNNSISRNVSDYLKKSLADPKCLRCLKNSPKHMRFVIDGCTKEGEGEHKLIPPALYYGCKRPVIVSEDNDVFIISCVHFTSFDMIQIKRKYDTFYNLNDIITNYLQYSVNTLINTCFLFGNDFIPPIISITENNPVLIHDAMYKCMEDYLPDVLYFVLSTLENSKKIRFSRVTYTDERVIVEYWKNCLWVLDYYAHKTFPQKYMRNKLFSIFDRNMLITALLDRDYSARTFEKARAKYAVLTAQPVTKKAISEVFPKNQLPNVERFFTNVQCNDYVDEINVRQ